MRKLGNIQITSNQQDKSGLQLTNLVSENTNKPHPIGVTDDGTVVKVDIGSTGGTSTELNNEIAFGIGDIKTEIRPDNSVLAEYSISNSYTSGYSFYNHIKIENEEFNQNGYAISGRTLYTNTIGFDFTDNIHYSQTDITEFRNAYVSFTLPLRGISDDEQNYQYDGVYVLEYDGVIQFYVPHVYIVREGRGPGQEGAKNTVLFFVNGIIQLPKSQSFDFNKVKIKTIFPSGFQLDKFFITNLDDFDKAIPGYANQPFDSLNEVKPISGGYGHYGPLAVFEDNAISNGGNNGNMMFGTVPGYIKPVVILLR